MEVELTDVGKARARTRGDILLIMMQGHSVPFNVVETVPNELIKIGPSTDLSIGSIPLSDIEDSETQKRRLRFRRLKEVEEKYAVDETLFYIPDPKGGESQHRSMDERDHQNSYEVGDKWGEDHRNPR